MCIGFLVFSTHYIVRSGYFSTADAAEVIDVLAAFNE